MRVELTQKPDSVSPVKHTFRVEPSRAPIEIFVWRPTRDGVQLREWGVDTEFEFRWAGGSERLSGRGRSDGKIEGGAYHYALLARKLPCEGFVPGFDPPRPARAGA